MNYPRFNELEKILIDFPQQNERSRIKNFSECSNTADYIWKAQTSLANSCIDCIDIIKKTTYAMEKELLGTRNALDKCSKGGNMNLDTSVNTMHGLIIRSNHILLAGNLLENFCEANEKGLVNVSINITPEMLIHWLVKGEITLEAFTYLNLTYLGKGINDRIIFNK